MTNIKKKVCDLIIGETGHFGDSRVKRTLFGFTLTYIEEMYFRDIFYQDGWGSKTVERTVFILYKDAVVDMDYEVDVLG